MNVVRNWIGVDGMSNKGALKIDKMAHSIMEFRPSGYGTVEHDGYTVFYHEECLYSVANKKHSIVSLVYASSPYHAIEKVKIQ